MKSTSLLVIALFLAVTLYAGSDNFTLADAILGAGQTEIVLDASHCSSHPITKDGGEFLAVKFQRLGFLMSFREFPKADRGRLDGHYRIGIILGRPSFQESPLVLYLHFNVQSEDYIYLQVFSLSRVEKDFQCEVFEDFASAAEYIGLRPSRSDHIKAALPSSPGRRVSPRRV
ncbi:MAG: hypothetical protein NZ742_02645 [Acidobacteria bacterium]|nr:hypothetical protein [Acidobacteriota bacterium]MDW7983846.1 hypothetical protein [Acidobacteriota bacterium]